MKKPTYITTSIAYINAEPHIGFLYELLAADVLKRYHRSLGDEVIFATGTDEHGTKVAQAAEAASLEPQAYADKLSESFRSLKDEFNIDYDYFIRTTDPAHQQFVQEKWQQLVDKKSLKKKTYSGLYCAGCEAFKTDGEVEAGKCALHNRELEKVEEENWFLIIDVAAKAKIKEFIETSVYPETRRQEVLNVLESGAYDEVSVSRSKAKLSWGVPVPNDPDQVMYVWVDALFNYLSVLALNDQKGCWPADIQIIGKDILKFHAIIWPALLLAVDEELPKKLLVHGFINVDGKKMSKSVGNVITPLQLKERYGVEATRYLLFRQLSFYDDSNFSWAEFDALYNGELANGLGNLVARAVTLLKKHNGVGAVNAALNDTDLESLNANLNDQDFGSIIEELITLITAANGWFSIEKPWEWPDDLKNPALVDGSNLITICRYLDFFMPETAKEIRQQLGSLESKPLFPRLAD